METAGSLDLATGLDAVARAEKAICGGAVTRAAPAAQGLALAGVRAASVEGPGAQPGRPHAGAIRPGASCVHHVGSTPARGSNAGFELAADSAQAAVDQALAAHLLSLWLCRPGLCSMPADVAEAFGLVRLPGAALVSAILEQDSARREPDAGPERIVELAGDALRAAARHTGRHAEVVERDGDADAGLILVGSRRGSASARRVLGALRAAGIPAARVAMNLVQPFPAEALAEALAGATRIVVVAEPVEGDELCTRVRAVAPADAEVTPACPADPDAVLAKLAPTLPPAAAGLATSRVEEPEGWIAAAPAGPWAEGLLREVVSVLGEGGSLKVSGAMSSGSGVCVLGWGGEAIPAAGARLLLAAAPGFIAGARDRGLLEARTTVVVMARADSVQALHSVLKEEAADLLAEREIRLHWVSAPGGEEREPAADTLEAASLTMAGAAVAVLRPGDVEAAAARLEVAGRARAAHWLRRGAARVEAVDPERVDQAGEAEEIDFRPASRHLRMPDPVDESEGGNSWDRSVAVFHWTGEAAVHPSPPPWPAAVEALLDEAGGPGSHALVVMASDDPEQVLHARPLAPLLVEAVGSLQAAGQVSRLLADHRSRLVVLVDSLVGDRSAPGDAADLLREAGRQLCEDLRLGLADGKAVEDDVKALVGALPAGARLFAATPDTVPRVYLEIQRARRVPRRRAFHREVEGLCERLREILQLDRIGSGEDRVPASLGSALGSSAGVLVDVDALSRTLPGAATSEPLDDVRRLRIQEILGRIEAELERVVEMPDVLCLQSPRVDLLELECEVWTHSDPLAAAIGAFDGVARRLGALLLSTRLARFELEGRPPPPEDRDAWDGLGWQALTPDELGLLPAVLVLTTGQELRQSGRGSLSELLSSRRPLRAIVLDPENDRLDGPGPPDLEIDLAQLAMAHRQALVIAASLAQPGPLVRGLAKAVDALRPAIAVVALPSPEPSDGRARRLQAALHGRSRPEFVYDPDAGPSLADRLDLGGNPEPERAWPVRRVTCVEDGVERSLELAVTYADAMALEPSGLRHFWVVPRVAWDDAQVPIADYLERISDGEDGHLVPFIWVIDDDHVLQRAIVTHELALACRDRLDAWRFLQELAGGGAAADGVAAGADDAPPADRETLRAELERLHAEELERIQEQTARETMQRVAARLLGPHAVSPATAGAGLAPGPLAPPPVADTVETTDEPADAIPGGPASTHLSVPAEADAPRPSAEK